MGDAIEGAVAQDSLNFDSLCAGASLQCMDDSHGRLAFAQIAGDGLAEHVFRCSEIKHVIDHSLDKIAYARLGYGDEQRRHQHIEAICQHFAACFLMPASWLKAAWGNGIQDVYNLASLFQVSVSAMEIRLRRLGLLDDEPERPPHTYFRHLSGLLLDYMPDRAIIKELKGGVVWTEL